LKESFLEAYDENEDGKIEIGEVCFDLKINDMNS
jgi:Ca2+-binding EF-hand superfamily protein